MIALNDFAAQWEDIRADVLAATDRVGASGRYILGKEVRRFEAALAQAWGVPHAVGVASGLDALEIALRATGLRAGDRVLTTPLSAFATTLAIVRAGGVPVFSDTDACGLLDLALCREALAKGPPIRFLLPVHLYGHALDLDALDALGEATGVTIVEDCAQAIGARSLGRPVGTAGLASAVSFYPTKNLGALGDAGAVVTADEGVAARARVLRHYGQTATYVHEELGLNSRLDELHAAVMADALLPRLARFTARRRAVAARYRAGLRAGAVSVPAAGDGSESVWHLFPVLVAPGARDAFRSFLADRGVATGVHYPVLIPEQNALARDGRFEVLGSLDNARRFAACEVSLPIHPYLEDADVDRVVASVNAWDGPCSPS